MSSEEKAPTPPELLQLLQQHLPRPTDGLAVRRSTEEVWRILEKHAPNTFTAQEVYNALVEMAYRTERIGDDILWVISA